MKSLKIAFSICGVGHGHYGRNIEIVKMLSNKLDHCEITLYTYDDTLNIFLMDKEIPKNVKIKKIPGFIFIYKNNGYFSSIISTIVNRSNWVVFLRTIKFSLIYAFSFFFMKILSIIKKTPFYINKNYYVQHFDYFDFAISDLEPLLPRVALIRGKPFLTFDNQHAMLYGDINISKFNFKERLEHFFVCTFLLIYHPRSELSILTSFYDIPVKKKYQKRVASVGPLFRKKIKDMKGREKYNNFILVYAHNVIRNRLFKILKKLNSNKFIIFTKFDESFEQIKEEAPHLEYHPIDPDNFIKYFLTCNAIIATAGNTALGEAIYFKKPFFAISLEGQFEQRLNRYLLEKQKWGYGCKLSELDESKILHFIKNIDFYKNNLKPVHVEDNTDKITDLILNKIKKDLNIKQ